jgi:hypothetical protein
MAAIGPSDKNGQGLENCRAQGCQAVLDAGWLGREHRPCDQAVAPNRSSKNFGSMCAGTAEVSRISRNSGRQGIISTAHVESVMNHLVNHRLSKKQQMRWSPEGAHYLLQVRAELLNGTLTDAYRIANPRFRGTSGFAPAVH